MPGLPSKTQGRTRAWQDLGLQHVLDVSIASTASQTQVQPLGCCLAPLAHRLTTLSTSRINRRYREFNGIPAATYSTSAGRGAWMTAAVQVGKLLCDPIRGFLSYEGEGSEEYAMFRSTPTQDGDAKKSYIRLHNLAHSPPFYTRIMRRKHHALRPH